MLNHKSRVEKRAPGTLDRLGSVTRVLKGTLMAGVMAACLLATNPAEAAVATRGDVTVDKNMVYLSDLFEGLEASKDHKIAVAPKPGEEVLFNRKVLTLLANRYQIDWMPMHSEQSVMVKRASLILDKNDITAAMANALRRYGDNLEIQLDNRLTKFHLMPGADATLTVRDLNYDASSTRFRASVQASNGERLSVTGRAFEIVELPVLAERLTNGDIIGKHHITYVKERSNTLSPNIITEAADLIGKTPRRSMSPNRAVREDEIMEPLMVEKGQLMVVILHTDQLQLTVRGKAMQDGSRGELIRVVNTQSNQSIEVKVTGPGRGKVTTTADIASLF